MPDPNTIDVPIPTDPVVIALRVENEDLRRQIETLKRQVEVARRRIVEAEDYAFNLLTQLEELKVDSNGNSEG